MGETRVDLAIEGARATVTFRADSGLVVLSAPVMEQLGAQVAAVTAASDVRWTVFASEGKAFAAGADIKSMAGATAGQARTYGELGQRVIDAIEALPSITIAAIHGAALGGGCELILGCDFRIAVTLAKIGLPEVTLGIVPGWSGMIRLTKLIGPARAKRMYLSGVPVTGEEALRLGLVDEVVDTVEELPGRVDALCRSFARAAPEAVRLAKRVSRDGDDLSAFAESFTYNDSREGIAAFMEKRPAAWMEEGNA